MTVATFLVSPCDLYKGMSRVRSPLEPILSARRRTRGLTAAPENFPLWEGGAGAHPVMVRSLSVRCCALVPALELGSHCVFRNRDSSHCHRNRSRPAFRRRPAALGDGSQPLPLGGGKLELAVLSGGIARGVARPAARSSESARNEETLALQPRIHETTSNCEFHHEMEQHAGQSLHKMKGSCEKSE